MSKAVLVIDMPDNCRDCEYFGFPCRLTKQRCNWFNEDGRNKNCPLREFPEKKSPTRIGMDYYNHGWNACIDVITGGDAE